MLLLAAPLHAQSAAEQTTTDQTLESSADAAQTATPPIQTVQPAQVRPAFWSTTAGFEGDTHNTGYGFIGPTYSKPISPNLALVAGGNVNYLFYEYPNGAERFVVHSPGVSMRGGVKLGGQNYVELGAGPSIKRQHTAVHDGTTDTVMRSFDRTIVGLNMGADIWVDPTKHNNVYGIVDYTTSDNYLWSRLAYKEQIANHDWSGKITPYVGIEGVAQGNRDVRSTQFGPFVEIVHVPSSLSIQLRGGWKRSTYQFGPDKTGPWFAIGFWRRL
jgi:hypothetical protein